MSVPFARVSGIDGRTAYYAMMPGGLSEMANIGARAGRACRADRPGAGRCASALLVCVMPPLIVSLGIHGDVEDLRARQPTPAPRRRVALALVRGAPASASQHWLRLNNPWMIGALRRPGAVLTATGLIDGHSRPGCSTSASS